MQTSWKDKLLGDSPWTSIIGYLLLILTVIHEYMKAGETDWMTMGVGVLMALLGRKASDSSK